MKTNLSRLKTLTEGINQLIIDTFGDILEENERLLGEPHVQKKSNAKKLSKREVAKIRELSRLGAKNVDIAYGYDINPATVSRIVRGIYFK